VVKIAILALHFRPDESIGSVRPENWAAWLGTQHDVVVVTREMSGEEVPGFNYKVVRPASALMRLLEVVNNYRKKHRLYRQVKKVAAEESSTSVVDTAPSGAFSYRMPCFYDLWFLSSYRGLQAIRPDVVVATHSPYTSLLVAWVYTLFNPRVKLWVDFRDLWVGNHLAVGLPCFRGVERWLERKVLGRADAITTVSEGLAEYFNALGYGSKTAVVYNAPAAAASARKRVASSGADLSVCYTGTIYSGWRDPSPLLEVVQCLANEGVISNNFVLNIASRNGGNIFELIKKYKVEQFVRFLGAVSRDQALALQEESDVLLMLESCDPKAKGVLTGKVFEYLATTKPILVIGPGPDSELYRLIDRHDRLIGLDVIEEVMRGAQILPVCEAVDYADISKQQLFEVIQRLVPDVAV
jgi:glycosyltransferase involved in cell wall biosynthesis